MDKLYIAFRGPALPVIIISKERLYTGYNRKSLSKYLGLSKPEEGEDSIRVIDSDGEEFMFIPKDMILAPGCAIRNWTKKQIIDLFNNSSNAKEAGIEYPLKSIPRKKLSLIIKEICVLIKSGERGRK